MSTYLHIHNILYLGESPKYPSSAVNFTQTNLIHIQYLSKLIKKLEALIIDIVQIYYCIILNKILYDFDHI